jgi:hypothetical protein
MTIELTPNEFRIHDNIKEFDNVDIDNSYDVLNYIANIKLKKDDPRMQSIMESQEFIIVVDKPNYMYRNQHTQRIKFEECCKCSYNHSMGKEYIHIQINYNKVTVIGSISERDYLIDNLLKN